ncbi:DUF5331 domain-containing protein [Oscillatoria sp. FACHB-1406]|uniref:DUF5331 domain-containing protein n=1 Tax=Oscillatoria sp. FACHB-1406 TaxID=2692846 RepID=UPI00168A3550|nr:DUF5331 domain-containing protein [Oscillatoria sp. FACHB-1406]MBD2577657.1 hypothetical protein [Oscillatoria sp. FACHB-1406]
MDFVEAFKELKSELKEEWLDFYEENYDWIETLGVYRDVTWSANSRDQSHYFLLGVLSALNPKFSGLLKVFKKLTSDPQKITKTIDIFDLDLAKELEKRAASKMQNAELISLPPESEAKKSNTDPDLEYLDRIRQDINQ